MTYFAVGVRRPGELFSTVQVDFTAKVREMEKHQEKEAGRDE